MIARMRRKFVKMHGLGNDFVVFDATREPLYLDTGQVRTIADRHRGIGCDQILVVEPSPSPDTDFYYRIFNADGGEVEQCGNGARCFARFVREQGLSDKSRLRVMTAGGPLTLEILADDRVRVAMGVPAFDPAQIPIAAQRRQAQYELPLEAGGHVRFAALNMGNPHAVIQVASVAQAPVVTLGPWLERHSFFPNRVNVGFMEIVDRRHFRLRVFERGVGETLACGSGACAAAVAGMHHGLLDSCVTAELRGGELELEWTGEFEPVMMTGEAVHVFDGHWPLETSPAKDGVTEFNCESDMPRVT